MYQSSNNGQGAPANAEWKTSKRWNPYNSFKLLVHTERWRNIRQGRPIPAPVLVTIDPSNVCNLHCVWCNAEYVRKRRNCMLSASTLQARFVHQGKRAQWLIDQAKDLMLIHPDIAKALLLLWCEFTPLSKFLLRHFGIDCALAIFIPKKYFKFFQILPRFFIALMELLLHLTILELSIGASHVRYLLESCLTSSDRNFVHYFLCGDEAHTCPAASDVLRDVFAQQLQIRQIHVSALS